MFNEESDYIDFAADVVAKALHKGVDEAEVYIEKGDKFSLEIKDGEIETLEQAGSKGMGLRILKDRKLAFGYTSDFSSESIEKLADELIVIAKYSDGDDCNGLPTSDMLVQNTVDLKLYDDRLAQITTPEKIDITRRMEAAARDYDKRVYKFRTSKFNDWAGITVLVNSSGFKISKKDTYCFIVCIPVAEEDKEKQMGFWFSVKRAFSELDSPEEVGRIAAERAVRMLGAKPVATSVMPVIFSPLEAASLCRGLGVSLGGQMIFRKNSFFVDKLGEKVASEKLTLVDDGLLPGALGSSPFDGEGILPGKKKLIDKGILKCYLFDLYYGRKLASNSTGNAARSYSSTPIISITNLYGEKGDRTPEEIIKSVDKGLYVTSTMGAGLDYVTGDYSVGAEGFMVEKGELTFPVSRVTISGNMTDMLQNILEVGNDLEMRNSVFAPTIMIDKMTVSGT